MVADSELQRIARLTPLADVLASFDLSVGPVEPREEAVAAALGMTLAADVAVAGEPSRSRAGAARRLCGARRRDAPTPAPTRRRRCRPRRHAIDTGERDARRRRRGGGARCRVRCSGTTVAGAGRGRARRRRAAGRRRCDARRQLRLTGARLRRIDVALLLALGIERVLVRQPRVRVVRAGAGEIIGGAAALIASAIEAEERRRDAIAERQHARSRAASTKTPTPSSRSAAPAAAATTQACARSRAPARSRSTASASRRAKPPRSASSARGRCCCCRAGSMRRWPAGSPSAAACWRGSRSA